MKTSTTGGRVPPIAQGTSGDDLVAAINDRIRRLGLAKDTSGGGTTGKVVSSSSSGELVLSVPGTIAIASSAAPLVSFPTDMQPSAIVALLKQGPKGGPVQLQLSAGTTQIGAVTLAVGVTSATVGNVGKIPANQVVTLAITSVGLAFPGSDLSVMVRF